MNLGEEMNTHDIELPPLPEWVDWPVTVSEMSASEIKEAMQAYARAALQSQDRRDAARYRYLIAKLQQAYDGDYFETDLISLYCHMPSQYKGERVVRAEITWRDKADEPIGLSEAIDHARHIEGDGE